MTRTPLKLEEDVILKKNGSWKHDVILIFFNIQGLLINL